MWEFLALFSSISILHSVYNIGIKMLTCVLNCPSAYQNDIELKNQSVSMSDPAVKMKPKG